MVSEAKDGGRPSWQGTIVRNGNRKLITGERPGEEEALYGREPEA